MNRQILPDLRLVGCAIAKLRRRSCAVLDKLPDRDAKLLGLVGKIG
jgi:hypothetical protein